jgi:hypothetical protein
VAVSWLERIPRDDVNSNSEQFLKILKQADVIKKRRAWLEIDQQIQVAVWTSLSPGDGAEHGDPTSTPLSRDAEDLGPPTA